MYVNDTYKVLHVLQLAKRSMDPEEKVTPAVWPCKAICPPPPPKKSRAGKTISFIKKKKKKKLMLSLKFKI